MFPEDVTQLAQQGFMLTIKIIEKWRVQNNECDVHTSAFRQGLTLYLGRVNFDLPWKDYTDILPKKFRT